MSVKFTILLLMVSSISFSQDFKKYFALTADINKPLSNVEFIKATSSRGAKFMYREKINEKFTAGLDLGFATYHDYLPPTAYDIPPATKIYTDVFGYVFNYTLTIAGEYYFVKDSWIMPFAGFGLGVSYSKLAQYYNIFGDEEKKVGGLFRPHLGTLMRFGKTSKFGAIFSTHLDYSTINSKTFEYKSFSNLGFQFGLFVMVTDKKIQL